MRAHGAKQPFDEGRVRGAVRAYYDLYPRAADARVIDQPRVAAGEAEAARLRGYSLDLRDEKLAAAPREPRHHKGQRAAVAYRAPVELYVIEQGRNYYRHDQRPARRSAPEQPVFEQRRPGGQKHGRRQHVRYEPGSNLYLLVHCELNCIVEPLRGQ